MISVILHGHTMVCDPAGAAACSVFPVGGAQSSSAAYRPGRARAISRGLQIGL